MSLIDHVQTNTRITSRLFDPTALDSRRRHHLEQRGGQWCCLCIEQRGGLRLGLCLGQRGRQQCGLHAEQCGGQRARQKWKLCVILFFNINGARID